jgi:hypothetical protein
VVHAGRFEIGVLPLTAWANFESGWAGLDWALRAGRPDGNDSWGLGVRMRRCEGKKDSIPCLGPVQISYLLRLVSTAAIIDAIDVLAGKSGVYSTVPIEEVHPDCSTSFSLRIHQSGVWRVEAM